MMSAANKTTTKTNPCSPESPDATSFFSRFKKWAVEVKTLLYSSHALQSWGDRMWIFSMGLFLVELTPGEEKSLQLTAANAMAMATALVLFSHLIGYWIDIFHRLPVIRTSIFVQNLCVIASNVLIYLSMTSLHPSWWVIGGVISLCMIGRLSSVASSISVEKDWVVVVAQTRHAPLTDMNAMMRRIDMLCNILAPLFIGTAISLIGSHKAVILIICWNCLSGILEYALLVKVYVSEPALTHQKNPVAPNFETLVEEESEAVPSGKLCVDVDPGEGGTGAGGARRDVKVGGNEFDYDYDNPETAGENGLLERTTRFDVSNIITRKTGQ